MRETWYAGHRSGKEQGAGKELEDLVVVLAVICVFLCRVVDCKASIFSKRQFQQIPEQVSVLLKGRWVSKCKF